MKKHSYLIPATVIMVALAGYDAAYAAGAAGASVGATTAGAGRATGGSTTATTGVGSTANSNTATTSTMINTSPNSTSTTPSTRAGTTTNGNAATNWTSENQYWQNQYATRPYYNSNTSYSTVAPAYQYGVDAYNQNSGKRYEDLNAAQLRSNWERTHANSNLTWDQAQPAVRDAYTRLYNNSTANGTNANGSLATSR